MPYGGRRASTGAGAGAGDGSGARRFLAYAALLTGATGTLSTFAFSATDAALMAAPAYGAILLSVGFALLSPRLLKGVLDRLPLTGASGWLAVRNLRRRADHLAGILMSLILFMAVATATLYMQSVENDAVKASGLTKSVSENLETLNITVVGIIVVFVGVMLVNARTRRPLTGSGVRAAAPRGCDSGMAGAGGVRGATATVTGLFFGTVAALAGIIPFTAVRTDSVLPDRGLGIWLAVVLDRGGGDVGDWSGHGSGRRRALRRWAWDWPHEPGRPCLWRRQWGSGYSAAPAYAELVDMHECRTARQLGALVGRLLPV
ncbi:hypothetical protein SALBM311S_05905 [Streptomyces alboniger]